MMTFIDAGAWIALTDTSDQYHYEAIQIYNVLKKQRVKIEHSGLCIGKQI